MKRIQIAFLLLFALTTALVAQNNNPIALKINGKPIYKDEVERTYLKGINTNDTKDERSFNQFVDGFVNYKLNVAEAKAQKLDTMKSFKRDYVSYRIMLADSYLKNPAIRNQVVNVFYGRLQQNVELNHTMLPFEKTAYLPADTLALYNKALAVREQLLKNGFKGKEYIDNTKTTSMVIDKDARNGYLGWVMAFTLQLPVENACYDMPLNEISMPIRSVKGYHIIQVLNRRPSAGLIDIEQVTFNFRQLPPSQHLKDSMGLAVQKIYDKLLKEKNFDELCSAYLRVTESDASDCSFGVQSLNANMPPVFLNAAFNLKNIGDVSAPIMTDYGYHIVRLKQRYAEPPLEDISRQLSDNIMTSDRSSYYTKIWRDWQSNKYGLKINQKAEDILHSLANTCSPSDSTFIEKITSENEILLTIDNKRSYKIIDFKKYLEKFAKTKEEKEEMNAPIMTNPQQVAAGLSTDILMENLKEFSANAIAHYADSTLEESHKEFGQIMEEYADGLLFYEIKNRNVWRKANEDHKGLNSFFKSNKSKYKWDAPQFKGTLILCKDQATHTKAIELLKSNKKNADWNAIAKQLNSEKGLAKIESGLWAAGENKYADTKLTNAPAPENSEYPLYILEGKVIKAPENANDAKPQIVSDFQQSLEDNWTKHLHKKYSVEKEESVLKSIEQ